MTRAVRLWLGAICAVVAIALLSYAGIYAYDKIKTLEGDVAYFQQQSQSFLDERGTFYAVLNRPDIRDTLRRAVNTDAQPDRMRAVQEVRSELRDLYARVPDGAFASNTFDTIVEASTPAERQEQLDVLYIHLFGSTEPAPITEPVLVSAEGVKLLTGLITAIGGFGSGLVSLLLFAVGGGKRTIEEDILEIDLEMKRVALAQARFDAREALSTAGNIPPTPG